MNIYLLRHGETDWNTTWKLQGKTDVPLNEKGITQAEMAAIRMRNKKIDYVFSSPLSRAKRTAEIIASPHRKEVHVDERLIELGFGAHEGTTPEDDPDQEDRRVLFKTPELYIPKEGAESYEELQNRCASFLEDLKKLPYENILIVAHGACNKGLIRAMMQADLKYFWKFPLLDNCEEVFIRYEDGVFYLPPVYEEFRPKGN